MSITAVGAKLARFNPPGYLEDLDEQGKIAWSAFISQIFDGVLKGRPQQNDGPRLQFFHPLKTEAAADQTEKVIQWVGFPRLVAIQNPGNARFKVADADRLVQDEYCEWSIVRRADGKITRVTFTCEGPEYWWFLGKTNPQLVTQLYKKYISPDVRQEDLFDANGEYIERNKWNNSTTNGAMHLIQDNNTLGAEIELAGGASIVRQKDGRILTDTQELIKCSRYGQPERNSDPKIGAEVNALARLKAYIALKDPVGLYFDTFEPEGWVTPPDTTPAKDYWRIERGTAAAPVRAVYEVPAEKGYCVGDIKINGKLIKYGGQIADFVRIKLTGIAQNIGKSDAPPTQGCRGSSPSITTLLPLVADTQPGGYKYKHASRYGKED